MQEDHSNKTTNKSNNPPDSAHNPTSATPSTSPTPTTQPVDKTRRRFLATATAVMGGVGAVATAVPFAASLLPSAKARAAGAPIEVDISKLPVGGMMTVAWRGKPVWIIHRSEEMLANLDKQESHLRDPESIVDQQPEYARNLYRSIKPERKRTS